MKHIHNNSDILLVCCVHGDEQFGLDVFFEFYGNTNVSLLLVNEEAIKHNIRYIETDLNRCFPGHPNGTYEEKLAYQILPIIKQYKYVLDIHTTTSNLVMTPIITKINDGIKNIIKRIIFPKEIVFIPEPYNKHSLIYQVDNGISLEFGEEYVKHNIEYALMMIEDIISGKNNPFSRNLKKDIYMIAGTLPYKLNHDKNFEKFINLFYDQPLYTFLVNEKNYEKIGNYGFVCNKISNITF